MLRRTTCALVVVCLMTLPVSASPLDSVASWWSSAWSVFVDWLDGSDTNCEGCEVADDEAGMTINPGG